MRRLLKVCTTVAGLGLSTVTCQGAFCQELQAQVVPGPGQQTSPPSDSQQTQNVRHATKLEGGVEIVGVKQAQDMVLPPDRYPGIHFFAQPNEFFFLYPDRSKVPSGLYLLDTQLIPRQLPEILRRNGLTLNPDGTLVNGAGEKVVMALRYKLVALTKKQGSLPGFHRFFALFGPTPAPLPAGVGQRLGELG
jgi:hypothetical protein